MKQADQDQVDKTEKSNVYSLMTRLKNQAHLRVPTTQSAVKKGLHPSAPVPAPAKLNHSRIPLQASPGFLKRVQTRGVIKAGHVICKGAEVRTLEPIWAQSGVSDAALIALRNDFKELSELQSRLHFMLKDLESFLEADPS